MIPEPSSSVCKIQRREILPWAIYKVRSLKEEQLLWDLKAEVVKNDVCVAFTKKLPAIKRTYEKTDVTPTSRISFIHKCAHNVW